MFYASHLMQLAASQSDFVFGEIAVQNELLTAQQVAECLRECLPDEKGQQTLGLPEICLKRGYLKPQQVQKLSRAQNFLRKHREDVQIARALRQQKLIRPKHVRACFKAQNDAYYRGDIAIPRLVELLDKYGILKRDRSEAALAAQMQTDYLAQASAGPIGAPLGTEKAFSNDWPEDPPVAAGTTHQSKLRNLREAHPDSRVRFHVNEILQKVASGQQHWSEFAPVKRPAKPEVPRAYYRFAVPNAYVKFSEASLLSFLHARSRQSQLIDISMGGLQMICPRAIDIGEQLRLDIHLPAIQHYLRSKGQVRWLSHLSNPSPHYRIGIEFTGLNESARKELKHLVREI